MSGLTMAAQDPFYIVKKRVQDTMVRLDTDIQRWQQMRAANDTVGDRFTKLTSQLQADAKSAGNDLADLAKTIAVVEKDRSKFPSITDVELDSRRSFVRETTAKKNKFEQTLRSEGQRQRDSRRALMDGVGSASGGRGSGGFNGNGYVQNQLQMQKDVEAQQDAVMGDMVEVLNRMKNQGSHIHGQLEEHRELLDDVHDEMDTANDSLGVSLMRMERLLNKKSRWKWTCIWMLIIVFIVQFILIATAI